MTRDLNQQEQDAIEAIIDGTSLKAVLEAISAICEEKADHIQANYNDPATARVWNEACGHVGCTSVSVRV